MTKPMMDLRALVEKSGDADLLRGMIGFAAERLMELEVGAKTGAGYGEKSSSSMATATGTGKRGQAALSYAFPACAPAPAFRRFLSPGVLWRRR